MQHGGDTSFELIRRCRHAAAAVGDLVSVYGGLRCGMLLDDLIVAENCHAAETTNDASPTAATTTTVAATKQTGRFLIYVLEWEVDSYPTADPYAKPVFMIENTVEESAISLSRHDPSMSIHNVTTFISPPSTARSVSMRDMGTEMTPSASQEPSRTGTPVRVTTSTRSPTSSRPSTPGRGAPTSSPIGPLNDCLDSNKNELSEKEIQMKICLHTTPAAIEARGTEWPEEWPKRHDTFLDWLENKDKLIADTEHWKAIVSESYLTGMGIDWSNARNILDMKSIYGGFVATIWYRGFTIKSSGSRHFGTQLLETFSPHWFTCLGSAA
ncbi:hypothetical protein AAG906_008701 [Vitis piasezkii]